MGHHASPLGVEIVAVHEELAGLVVQARLGEGNDEEAADDREGVAKRHGFVPVLFEGVDADVAVRRHVRVVDLGQEEAPRRRLRVVLAQNQL